MCHIRHKSVYHDTNMWYKAQMAGFVAHPCKKRRRLIVGRCPWIRNEPQERPSKSASWRAGSARLPPCCPGRGAISILRRRTLPRSSGGPATRLRMSRPGAGRSRPQSSPYSPAHSKWIRKRYSAEFSAGLCSAPRTPATPQKREPWPGTLTPVRADGSGGSSDWAYTYGY